MSDADNHIVKSLYDLPTYQRRLRHVRSITLRNLQCKTYHGKDIAKLHVCFTLHVDSQQKEFYRSETITGSLNPSWNSFDVCQFEEEIDIQAKDLVVMVWINNSSKMDNAKLLVQMNINMTGLQYFSDKLQQDKYKYVPNMLLIGMFDKFFIAPEISLPPDQDTLLVDSGTSLRQSYNINSLARIHTVLRAIKQMQASVKRVHRSIEDKLLTSKEKTRTLSRREDALLHVGQVRSELRWQMSQLQLQKDSLENCRRARHEKSTKLKGNFHQLEEDKQTLEDKKKLYFQTREKFIKENAQLLIRRKQLIGELTTYIYPVNEMKTQRMCICGVHLPNSEQFHGQDDSMYSVSLGYTCHLVLMMSQILDFPLRYLMEYKGSKSLVTDHIHSKLTEKDKTFPLFSKGKEKFQFNYGVFLLNKNISQLRFYCGLGTSDLRMTLPNIKSMLELRLGVKFDHLNMGRTVLDAKDQGSSLSIENAETVSSFASGGKNSVPDSAEEALERVLNKSTNGHRETTPETNQNIPLSLSDLPRCRNDNIPSEDEELFKPSEDDAFFKIKTAPFVDISAGTSSCGSYSEHTNGMTVSSRNFSLSPSPGSADHDLSADNLDLDPSQSEAGVHSSYDPELSDKAPGDQEEQATCDKPKCTSRTLNGDLVNEDQTLHKENNDRNGDRTKTRLKEDMS